MSLTMKEKQAVTKQLALTYKRAGKKEKGKILDAVMDCNARDTTLFQAACWGIMVCVLRIP